MAKIPDPFIFDLETGGFHSTGKKASSLLSVSSSYRNQLFESFSPPVKGTWVSQFSESTILPQLQKAQQLQSEESSIRGFIKNLRGATGAPIVGYNIKHFDLPFLMGRAHQYGLEKELSSALKGHRTIDVGIRVRNIIAESISENIYKGTFREELGGRTWQEAVAHFDALKEADRPAAYTTLRGVEAYNRALVQADRTGSRASLDTTRLFAGWKQGAIYSLFDPTSDLAKSAHASTADVKMTQRLYEAIGSGEFQKRAVEPSFAKAWLQSTVEQRAMTPTKAERAMGSFYHPTPMSRITSKWKMLSPATRKFAGGAGLVGGALLTAGAVSSLFSGRDDAYNKIEGLRHGGLGGKLRKEITDFGSPVDLAKATMRASKLYKSRVSKLLGRKNINWMEDISEEGTGYALSLVAKDEQGKMLMGFSRVFEKDTIDLTSFEVAKELRGGLGKKFYEQEARIFKKIGYEAGEEITSPVSSPITARWQMQMYGSKIDPFYEGQRGIGHLPDLEHRILNKQMALEDMPGLTMTGKIPGKDDSYNTIQGLRHGGLAAQMREKDTPFGSGWDALRNLTKNGESFQAMISSKAFKASLSNATEVEVLASGAFGKAMHMKSSFRGQDFSFVRKTGEIGEQEASILRIFQDDFAPSLYGYGKSGYGKAGQDYLDMEMFTGQDFFESVRQGKLADQHLAAASAAIHKMHQKGFVHSDLHSGNLMLTKEGNVGIVDFGASGAVTTTPNLWGPNSRGERVQKILGGHGRSIDGLPQPRSFEWDTSMYAGFVEKRNRFVKKMEEMTTDIEEFRPPSVSSSKSAVILENKPSMLNVPSDQDIQLKKLARSQLNRFASEEITRAGRHGGRKSRMG